MEWKSSRMAEVIKTADKWLSKYDPNSAEDHPPRRRKTPFSKGFESTDGYRQAPAA